MEIKTKYNIGDVVYYIGYKTVEKTCECCGSVYDESYPSEVRKGIVYGILVNDNFLDNKGQKCVSYKLSSDGQYFITTRDEDKVFATEEEAEIAFRMEVE